MDHSTEILEPDAECRLCPRLVEFRDRNRQCNPAWHNAPVPAFGCSNAELLIVGLAPGLRGANLTGRPFTGDYAGALLFATLSKFSFAVGNYGSTADDSLRLVNCRITNAVRCVPPENKPTGPETTTCRSFLVSEVAGMTRLKVILALGGLAHGAVLATLDERKSAFKFRHGAWHQLSNGLILADSYHCSRYNTNTRKLTELMFHEVFERITEFLPT